MRPITIIAAVAVAVALLTAAGASAATPAATAEADILPWCVYTNIDTPEEIGDCFVDYYGGGAYPFMPFQPIPDPEDHARDTGGLETSPYTVPATCTETACPSWTYDADAPERPMPAWVPEMPIYRALLAQGPIKDETTFFQSDAAVTAYAAYADCPYRFVCAWQHAGFRGRMFQGNRVAWDYEMDLYGLGGKVSSVRNRGKTMFMCGHAGSTGRWALPPKHNTSTMGKFNDRTQIIFIYEGC